MQFIKKTLMVAGLIGCFSAKVAPVVIIIHGTFATDENWHKPGGDFFKAVNRSLWAYAAEKSKESGNKQRVESVVSFVWDGDNDHVSRIEAAENLAMLCLSYPDNESITMFAHSHGGAIAALTSQFMYNPVSRMALALREKATKAVSDDKTSKDVIVVQEIIESEDLLALEDEVSKEKIVRDYISQQAGQFVLDALQEWDSKHNDSGFETKTEIDSHIEQCRGCQKIAGVKSVYFANQHESRDEYAARIGARIIQVYESIWFESLKKRVAFSEDTKAGTLMTVNTGSQRTINYVAQLGTPVCEKSYKPNMAVIKGLFSLYSEGDIIQPVLGLYSRTYTPAERLLNLQVSVRNNKGSFCLPSHTELHSPFIGSWLFRLPDIIVKEFKVDPTDFKEYKNLSILFFEDGSKPVIMKSL